VKSVPLNRVTPLVRTGGPLETRRNELRWRSNRLASLPG